MNTLEKVLGAMRVPENNTTKLYQTPVGKMTYLNTLVFSSLDGAHGFLGDTIIKYIEPLGLIDVKTKLGIDDKDDTVFNIVKETGPLDSLDGRTKLGIDDKDDNLYLVQLEGVSIDTCYEIVVDNVANPDAKIIKCSSLIPWLVEGVWVRTKDLKVGMKLGLNDEIRVVAITQIGPNPVYSLKSVIGRDRLLIEGCLCAPVGIVNVSVWVKHTDSSGSPTGDESLVIDRQWLRTRDAVSFYWNMPLDENSQVHVRADTPMIDVVTYGVELEHVDKKRISSDENIYSKTKALEPVDYGDFVKTYTVTSEQLLHLTKSGYSSNVTNIVISNTTEEVASVIAKIHTKFGDFITQPNIRIAPHQHHHYRIGTSLLSTIQLSSNEGISMESNLPVKITIYGHENEERE